MSQRLRLPSPAAATVMLALVAAGARFVVAANVATPLLYPDEYVHTALARSIVDGTFPHVRGGSVSFFSYLAPALMAPAWLISNVDVAYRVLQAFQCCVFAAAAAPAYLLARRIGVTGYRATAVAALALAIPDGIYTSGLLAESYTYPVFLLGVLVAVDAIGAPTTRNQLALIALAAVLPLLAGAQMVVLGAAYLPAAYLAGPHAPRAFLRAQRVVFIAIAAGVAVLAAAIATSASQKLLVVYETGTRSFHYPILRTLEWFGADLFVTGIAAGWVIMPGALLGLRSLVTERDPRRRAFGTLTLTLTAALVLEATPFGVNVDDIVERYAFYSAPLLVACCAFALERGLLTPRATAYLGVVAVVVAVLLPVNGPLLATHLDESPTLQGLDRLSSSGAAVWGPLLAVAAAAASWRRARAWILVLAGLISIVITAGASANLVQATRHASDVRAAAPEGSELVTWSGGDGVVLMRTLFWNRHASRVLVLGLGTAPDGFPSQPAGLAPGPRIETRDGRTAAGPYLFMEDALVIGGGKHTGHGSTLVVEKAPSVIAFGWDRRTGSITPGAAIYAVTGSRPARLVIGLRATDEKRKSIAIRCDDGLNRQAEVGVSPVTLVVPIKRDRLQTCRVRLLRGSITYAEGKPASLGGTLALRAG